MLQDRDKLGWMQIGVLTAAVIYCYWNTLVGTAEAWTSPMYSHGYLIPAFAAFLLYLRREPFGEVTMLERWWGVGIVTAAIVIRVIGSRRVEFTVDRLSLIPCLLGVFVLVGGFRTLRWAGPAIGFLAFMFPLPGFLVDKLLRPMQTMATMSSVFALQVFGLDVYREGNRIELESQTMSVVDQCSGLRMLTIFVALAVAIAMISTHRPWWERILILVSSVPIALLVNCIRITMTGLLYSLNVNENIANQIFHDFAGLIMMPIALGLMFLLMQILSHLFIEDKSAPSASLGMGLAGDTVAAVDTSRLRR
jgi:exosortase